MTIPTKDKNENDLRILLGENNSQENKAQTPHAIALAKLHPFHEHPYKVEDNDEMAELRESIRTHGVLSPILVRPTEDGEYEIVSGHRRVFACRRLGLKDVPAIVQPMTQEEAVAEDGGQQSAPRTVVTVRESVCLQNETGCDQAQRKKFVATCDKVRFRSRSRCGNGGKPGYGIPLYPADKPCSTAS